jgi:hypothetical protein
MIFYCRALRQPARICFMGSVHSQAWMRRPCLFKGVSALFSSGAAPAARMNFFARENPDSQAKKIACRPRLFLADSVIVASSFCNNQE